MIRKTLSVTNWKKKVELCKDFIALDLSKDYNINSIKSLSYNSWNAIFRGENNKKTFFVKIYNDVTGETSLTRRKLKEILTIAKALKQKGFHNIVTPIKSQRGQYFSRCGGYLVVVYPWIDHVISNQLSEDKAQKQNIARDCAHVLRNLHEKSKQIPILEFNFEPMLPHSFNPYFWALYQKNIWKNFEENFKEISSSPSIMNLIKYIKKESFNIIVNNPWFFNNFMNDMIFVHGDYRPENLVLTTGGQTFIIDFDLAHIDYPECDLVYSSLCFAGRRWLNGKRDWDIFSTFISNYLKASKVNIFSSSRFRIALRWTVLKWISLSFKIDQLFARVDIYSDLLKVEKMILNF